MDDEVAHRHEKSTAGRDITLLIVATIIFAVLWEYLAPDESTKYMLAGFLLGVAIGFVLRLFTAPKR